MRGRGRFRIGAALAAAVLSWGAGAAHSATAATAATGASGSGSPGGEPTVAAALDPDEAYRFSRAAVGRTPGDYAFLDREARQVRLAAYRGKPLLVNFVYTGCISACPATTKRIADLIGEASRTLGPGQFNVVSIGINPPADSPESMRDFARRFGLERSNWEFLTPYAQQVGALTADFGFRFVPTAWGFDHVAQVTIVDAQGRIDRQIYGADFELRRLIDPLQALITGAPMPVASVADIVDRVRILCTVYDPNTGAYRLDYSIVAQLIGISLATLTLLAFLAVELRRRRRASTAVSPEQRADGAAASV